MAHFAKIQTTQQGKNIILAGQNKQSVVFTKVELGDGLLDEGQSVDDMTALVHSVMSLPLQNFVNNGDGTARLRFVLDNNNLSKGFFNREIGVFAKVGDGTEQLFAYTNAGNLADYIPGKESPISSKIINLHIIVGNAANLTIVAENSAYVTKLDMDGHKTQEVLDHPDGSVTTPKIRDEAVTGAKIAQASIEKKHLKKGGISAEDVGAYSKGETDEKITALVNSAPGALDTLQELAAALGNDANFAATITNALAGKVSKSGDTITGKIVFSNSDEVKKSIFPSHYYHNVFADNNRGTFVHAYSETNPPQYQTSYEIRISVGNGRYKPFRFDNDGLHTDLKGNADTASNAEKLGGQPLAWIVDQINAAKTGIVAGNLAPNGWVKFANGLIVQWGMGSEQISEDTQTVIFPITFSRECFSLISGTMILRPGERNNSMWQVATVERERAVLFHQYFSIDVIEKTKPTYIAIGV